MVCRARSTRLSRGAAGGFLLIQLVVYLAITAMIVLFTMQWAVSALMHYYRIAQRNRMVITMTCATDVWVRDTRSSCGPLHYHQNKWLWSLGDSYVAWYLKDHDLVRAEGSYTHDRWHERTRTLMAEKIESLDICSEADIVLLRIESAKDALCQAPYSCTRMVHTYA